MKININIRDSPVKVGQWFVSAWNTVSIFRIHSIVEEKVYYYSRDPKEYDYHESIPKRVSNYNTINDTLEEFKIGNYKPISFSRKELIDKYLDNDIIKFEEIP